MKRALPVLALVLILATGCGSSQADNGTATEQDTLVGQTVRQASNAITQDYGSYQITRTGNCYNLAEQYTQTDEWRQAYSQNFFPSLYYIADDPPNLAALVSRDRRCFTAVDTMSRGVKAMIELTSTLEAGSMIHLND